MKCYVIDLFDDLDTRPVCAGYRRAKYADSAFDREVLLNAAAQLDPQAECGVIYGSGFESSPDVLDSLCRHRTLLGNNVPAIKQVKNPAWLAQTLAALKIPHPEIRFDPPLEPGWLNKRTGACGGGHVSWRTGGGIDRYFQRYVEGRLLSLSVLSDGRDAVIAGYCEQWCAENVPGQPFARGGAVAIAASELSAALQNSLREAVQTLTETTGLRGLWNIDFITRDGEWWLLEINPRPGATFELHEHDNSLLNQHIRALRGKLPEKYPPPATYKAHGVVYAHYPLLVPRWNWPGWSSDRPRPGSRIAIAQPVCMIHADGSHSTGARSTLYRREQQLQEIFRQWQTTVH